MNELVKKLEKAGIVPVIKFKNPEKDALPLGKALEKGKMTFAEVTFRAEGAEKAIKIMSEGCPSLIVGAGTVLSVSQADKALEAGAKFIVSPGFDAELVSYALKKNVLVIPGCETASEFQAAVKAGLGIVKFFPAEQSGGIAKLKALSAPFPFVKIMPTGGISLENLSSYLSCPSVIACGGSFMVKDSLIESERWDKVSELCLDCVRIAEEAKNE